MNTTLRTLSAALAAALISPSVFAASATLPGIDFHGYMRAGVGVSGDGSQAEWQKNKIGRLGNESDTYGELELGSEVYKKNDVSFYLDSMVSMVSDGSNDNETTLDDDAQFGLRQLNLQIKGLVPGDPNAVNATTSATISTSLIPNTGTFPDPVPGSKTIRSARGPFHLPGSAEMPMTSTTASMAIATSTLTTSTCATQAGSRGPVRGPNLVSTTRCRIPLKSRTPTVVYTMLKTASC